MYCYLDFIPDFTSTSLSELARTRMITSPALHSFLFKKLFTRASKKLLNLHVGRPEKKHSLVTQFPIRCAQLTMMCIRFAVNRFSFFFLFLAL